jgi:hypothetical protein
MRRDTFPQIVLAAPRHDRVDETVASATSEVVIAEAKPGQIIRIGGN